MIVYITLLWLVVMVFQGLQMILKKYANLGKEILIVAEEDHFYVFINTEHQDLPLISHLLL